MRALLVVLGFATPVLAQDGGVNGPTIGTRCSGPDDCKVDLVSAPRIRAQRARLQGTAPR